MAPYFFVWGVNTNCSNMVKDTDFKFQKHVPRSDSERISMAARFSRFDTIHASDGRTDYGIAVAYNALQHRPTVASKKAML